LIAYRKLDPRLPNIHHQEWVKAQRAEEEASKLRSSTPSTASSEQTQTPSTPTPSSSVLSIGQWKKHLEGEWSKSSEQASLSPSTKKQNPPPQRSISPPPSNIPLPIGPKSLAEVGTPFKPRTSVYRRPSTFTSKTQKEPETSPPTSTAISPVSTINPTPQGQSARVESWKEAGLASKASQHSEKSILGSALKGWQQSAKELASQPKSQTPQTIKTSATPIIPGSKASPLSSSLSAQATQHSEKSILGSALKGWHQSAKELASQPKPQPTIKSGLAAISSKPIPGPTASPVSFADPSPSTLQTESSGSVEEQIKKINEHTEMINKKIDEIKGELCSSEESYTFC
jgi:hypothetical protein